jgi:hypothetical protein
LLVELVLAEGLCWGIGIAFGGVGVERSLMNSLLGSLKLLDLPLLSGR